ncbi:MAG: hypothetical protein E6K67_06085, partial [Nitrospirae bacterium]
MEDTPRNTPDIEEPEILPEEEDLPLDGIPVAEIEDTKPLPEEEDKTLAPYDPLRRYLAEVRKYPF